MATAQITGTGTGWCSDYSGRNFRCGSGGNSSSGGGYGGGGCSHTAQQSASYQTDNDRRWASTFNSTGVKAYNAGNYAEAAKNFQAAVENFKSQSATIKKNFAEALYQLGREAIAADSIPSASMYFYRALLQKPDYDSAKQRLNQTTQLIQGENSCDLCSKAILSDVKYGLDHSANFSNYSIQAGANWDNCLKRFSVTCKNTAGADLKALRIQCNKLFLTKSEDAEKSCVRQAYEDARRKYDTTH